MGTDAKSLDQMSPQEKRAYLAELLRARPAKPKELPLSFAQQRLWFLDRLHTGSPLYNIPAAVRLPMPVQTAALERSLQEIVRRHESLRTTFREIGGEARQVIAPTGRIDLAVSDIRSLPATVREAEVQRLAANEAQRGFDLSTGPLLHATLVRCGDADHVLLLTMHHIVSDAWSLGVLFKEIAALYDAYSSGRESPLAPLPIQYGDFAVWQRQWLCGAQLETLLGYWKTALDDAPIVLDLPLDRARPPVQSFRGALQMFAVPPAVVKTLKALSQREEVTLFMTLLAAFFALLHRYTSQRDLLVGTPIANRNREELEGLIGFFVNSLVLRSRVSGNPTFRELLAQVRETTLEAYAHQDLPFEKLVEELHRERTLSHNPLFQVMFTLQTAVGAASAASRDAVQPVSDELPPQVAGTAKFDLSLSLTETDSGLVGGLEYSTDLFEPATIARMAGHFRTLLEAVAADPESRLWHVSLLSSAQREQQFVEWNATAAPYPDSHTAHELFAAQAERTPDLPAVEYGDRELTYRELNARANQLAHELISRGVGPDVRVGLCVERSIEMIVGLLAVLKAGGAYVPLDPDYPKRRLSYLLDDSQPLVLLTEARLLDRLPGHRAAVVCLDRDWPEISRRSTVTPPSSTGPDNLAYVIYTSGSTGNPKGVMVPHRGVANLWSAEQRFFGLRSSDRVLQFVSLSFDISVWDILLAFGAGATLVLGSRDELQAGAPLSQFLRERRVTATTLLPSVYLTIDPLNLPALQTAISGGELCTGDVVARLAPGRRFINGYGPTENTVAATLTQPWTDTSRRPPIGKPLQNVELYVLDERFQPLPVGVPGELFIGGVALARGYMNRPDLTAASFVPHPYSAVPGRRLYRTGDRVRYLADGYVEFLGRVDEQVKVRGHRVELGEVEAVMRGHAAVQDAAVVVRAAGSSQALAAYFVRAGDRQIATSELRAFLKERLPEYMVPASYTELDALPLTPNAKVDRKKLAALCADPAAPADYVEPRSPLEKAVAAIWKEVIGVPRVGLHDNFFELGGHSLSATQVISRVRSQFSIDIPLRSLFEAADVEGFVQTIERAQGGAASVAPIAAAPARERQAPLSFAQQRLWILNRLQPDAWTYNLPGAIPLNVPLQRAVLERALNEIVQRHEALRTTFATVDGEARQVVVAERPIELPLFDLSEWPEAARQAEVQRLLADELHRSFDLERGPLLRAALVRFSASQHLLLLVMHHIVSDAWSMKILCQELAAAYDAFSAGRGSPLTPLPIQYPDFAIWQRQQLQGETLDSLLAYWKAALNGAPQVMRLPFDRERPPVPSGRGAALTFTIDRAVASGLRAIGQREGVTLFMTLLAAFVTLLHRSTGHDDLVVGTPIANRNRVELEGLIGFFVNSLVLRARVSGGETFQQLLARVRETTLAAYAHQDLPFEVLVEELRPERTLSVNPLFQVMFSFQTLLARDFGWTNPIPADVRSTPVVHGSAKFDLSAALVDTDQDLIGGFEYSTDLFDDTTIANLADDFVVILGIVAADVKCTVDEIGRRVAIAEAARRSTRERDYHALRRRALDVGRRGVPL